MLPRDYVDRVRRVQCCCYIQAMIYYRACGAQSLRAEPAHRESAHRACTQSLQIESLSVLIECNKTFTHLSDSKNARSKPLWLLKNVKYVHREMFPDQHGHKICNISSCYLPHRLIYPSHLHACRANLCCRWMPAERAHMSNYLSLILV